MGAIEKLRSFATGVVFGTSRQVSDCSLPRTMTFDLESPSPTELARAYPAKAGAPRMLTFDLDGTEGRGIGSDLNRENRAST